MDPTLPDWLYRSEAFVEDLPEAMIGDEEDGATPADLRIALALHTPTDRFPKLGAWMLPALAAAVTVCGPIWAVAAGL